MTLIYCGQEVANDKRPDLFNKDTINWNTGFDLSTDMSILSKIKRDAVFTDSVYSLKAYDEEKMVGIFNFERKEADVEVDLADGSYINLCDGRMVKIFDGKIHSIDRPIIIKSKKIK